MKEYNFNINRVAEHLEKETQTIYSTGRVLFQIMFNSALA